MSVAVKNKLIGILKILLPRFFLFFLINKMMFRWVKLVMGIKEYSDHDENNKIQNKMIIVNRRIMIEINHSSHFFRNVGILFM